MRYFIIISIILGNLYCSNTSSRIGLIQKINYNVPFTEQDISECSMVYKTLQNSWRTGCDRLLRNFHAQNPDRYTKLQTKYTNLPQFKNGKIIKVNKNFDPKITPEIKENSIQKKSEKKETASRKPRVDKTAHTKKLKLDQDTQP